MRKPPSDLGHRKPDALQNLVGDGMFSLRRIGAGEAMGGCEQILVDLAQRVERLERILEYRLNLPHERLAGLAAGKRSDVDAAKPQMAAARQFGAEDHVG